MAPISPDRWRILSPHLDEAFEMATDERDAWLTSLRAVDPALAGDLEVLLTEHDALHASRFLERAVLDPHAAPSPSLEGHVLGAYRLVSPIGQGGTGSVWLAERCDGRFQGRAAIKLLNTALIGRAGEERFRREGTFLARLRHPRIAHLIDAGVSATAQPYLVLEYVDGQSIDRYCDERTLTVERRIRLFVDVLEAVAHAHANLIVHRDIKPANVLVSVDGQVKLLDFGIAKLVEVNAEWGDGGASHASALTREAGSALTPEYAAPEQIVGGPVTTATDVYSLGVLLYVLLTGQHPAGRALASPATLVQAIVGSEPHRPSEAVVSGAEPQERLDRHAQQCGTTPGRLSRLLHGDLDTIVAKALKKDVSERYASVTALADDLWRFLRHEPISARPDTLRYRAARFVRRHRASIGTLSAVVALVAGLLVFHTLRLSAERDRARREAAKAVRASELMKGLLASADPFTIRTTSGEPTIRGLLDASAAQVRRELADQPELQSELLTMMGRTYRRLAAYQTAQQLLEQALVSGRRAFGPEHVQVAQTLDYLGVVQADQGHYAVAARTLEEALTMRRKLLGSRHGDVAVTLAELGRVYQDQALNERAEPLHREALDIRRTVLGNEHPEVAVSLSDLASVLRLRNDLSTAERLLRQCLELNRKTRGPEHPNTSTTMHDLALIAASRGDYGGAESLLRQVLALQRKAPGAQHPTVATTLNTLSRVLSHSNRYEEAAAALQAALDIVRPRLGVDHQLVAIYAINAGAIHLARGDSKAAEPLLREGLRVRSLAPGIVPARRRTFHDDDWSLGATKSLLGAALTGLHRYDEAEVMLLDALHDLESSPKPRRVDVDETIGRLAELYSLWGKPHVAAAYRSRLSP